MKRIQVGILIFDEVEVLDFCGPFEVFSITRMDEEKRLEESSPFEVFLIAEKEGPVTTSGGMRVTPDGTLEQCPPLEILVVPGGLGTRREMNNSRLLDWIGTRAKQVKTVASVCTGSLLLGRAGLLDGRRATTHWGTLDLLEKLFPGTIVERELRFVEDGNVITSAGVSAGIDMALAVVAKYLGEEIARATARRMEYPFPESGARGVPLV